MTTKHPIDFDSYDLGGVITADTIERAYGINRGDDRYWRSQLAMREAAERAFYERGVVVTIASRRDDLVILTHPEASRHNQRAFRKFLRGAMRAVARHAGVDVDQLGPDDRVGHALEQARMARTVQAIQRSRRAPVAITGNVARPGSE